MKIELRALIAPVTQAIILQWFYPESDEVVTSFVFPKSNPLYGKARESLQGRGIRKVFCITADEIIFSDECGQTPLYERQPDSEHDLHLQGVDD